MQKKIIKIGPKIMLRGSLLPKQPGSCGVSFCPEGGERGPDSFALNPPSQLVIGYHWLAFLYQVRGVEDAFVKVSNSLKIVRTKSTIFYNIKVAYI